MLSAIGAAGAAEDYLSRWWRRGRSVHRERRRLRGPGDVREPPEKTLPPLGFKRIAAFSVLGVCALGGLAAGLWLTFAPWSSDLSASRAGPWPGTSDLDFTYVADLTGNEPFAESASVSPRDVLLVRVRLLPSDQLTWRINFSPQEVTDSSAALVLALEGSFPNKPRVLRVLTSGRLSFSVIHGSTLLRDTYGDPVRRLPDTVASPQGLLVAVPRPGDVWFVDFRLRASTLGEKNRGQLAVDALTCDEQMKPPATAPLVINTSSVIVCRVRVQNRGPGEMTDATLRTSVNSPRDSTDVIVSVLFRGDAGRSQQRVTVLSRRMYPLSRRLTFVGGRVLDASGQFVATLATDPGEGGVPTGSLGAGSQRARIFELLYAPIQPRGWGPPRLTFTWQRPADYVTFNSITNNPTYGDERGFFEVRHRGVHGGQDALLVRDKDLLVFNLLYENSAASSATIGGRRVTFVAHGTRVRIVLPTTPARVTYVKAYISALDARPRIVWDTATLVGRKPFSLEYVRRSGQIWTNAVSGKIVSDEIVTSTGALIGYKVLNGEIASAGGQFSGWVTIMARVRMP